MRHLVVLALAAFVASGTAASASASCNDVADYARVAASRFHSYVEQTVDTASRTGKFDRRDWEAHVRRSQLDLARTVAWYRVECQAGTVVRLPSDRPWRTMLVQQLCDPDEAIRQDHHRTACVLRPLPAQAGEREHAGQG